MQRNLEYAINESFEYLAMPLKEKSLLFIEGNSKAVRGDCSALLYYCQNDSYFDDWKIYWAAPDLSVLQFEYEELVHDRVEFLVFGSQGFREAIETVSVIVSSVLMPFYYIKREDQMLISIFREQSFDLGDLMRKNRVQTHVMLSKSDLVVLTDNDAAEYIETWYGDKYPFKLISGQPLRYSLPNRQPKDVVVSVSDATLGKSFADLENKYKAVSLVCCDTNSSVAFRISHNLWGLFQKENSPELLSNTTSMMYPLSSSSHEGSIVISDRKTDLEEAINLNYPCIFISNNAYDIKEYREYEQFHLVSEWDKAVNKLGELIVDPVVRSGKNEMVQRSHEALETIIDEIKKDGRMPNTFVTDRDLFVIRGNLNRKTWKLLGMCNLDKKVDILLRETDKNSVWKSKQPIPEDIRVFCRTGGGNRTNNALITEEDFQKEYNRIMGNNKYDRIVFVGSLSEFWEPIVSKGTENPLEILTIQEYFEFLLEHLDNPVYKEEQSLDDLVHIDTIEDTRYLYLGERGIQKYYVKEKGEIANSTLVYIDNKMDASMVHKLVDESDENSTFFIKDRRQYLKEDPIIERENVYWIPTTSTPVKLFLLAERIAYCKDQTMNAIFKHLGKELVLIEEQEEEMEFISSRCGLLFAEDINEMIL